MSPRARTLALCAALAAVAVFVTSFVLGITSADRAGDYVVREPAAVPDALGERLRVEVLNGAGSEGLARRATRLLRDRGFDVVYFGNAAEFGRDSSVVLDRVGDPEAARRVASALGIDRVEAEPNPDLLLEATVILGLDWSPADSGPSGGWWGRFRRWLGGVLDRP